MVNKSWKHGVDNPKLWLRISATSEAISNPTRNEWTEFIKKQEHNQNNQENQDNHNQDELKSNITVAFMKQMVKMSRYAKSSIV